MNKTKKRLLPCLLLAMGGLNLGTGVSNAQPKDATNTSNVSSEKTKKSSKSSCFLNLKFSDFLDFRNGIDILGLLTIIYGGKKLRYKNNECELCRSNLSKNVGDYNSLVNEHNLLKDEYDSLKKKCEFAEQNLLSNKHNYHEMENFKLLNTFQNFFISCFKDGVEFSEYCFEKLNEEDFGDYDIVKFNTSAFDQGKSFMSAYLIQHSSFDKKKGCSRMTYFHVINLYQLMIVFLRTVLLI